MAGSQPSQALSLTLIGGRDYKSPVGYVVGYRTGAVFWFVLNADRTTTLQGIPADSFTVGLICPDHTRDYDRTVTIGIGEHPTLAFHTGLVGTDLSFLQLIGPGTATSVSLQGCALQDVLRPLLLRRGKSVVTGEEASSLVAEMSGDKQPLRGELPLRTPVELLMAELLYMGSFSSGPERAAHDQQVENLLTGQMQEWSRGKGRPVVGRQEFRDKQNRYLLGVLAAMTEENELREGQTNTLTVRYFPSSQVLPANGGDPYSVEVVPDAAHLAQDYHVDIERRQGEPRQQVAPVAGQVEWTFALKPLRGFRECSNLGLTYRLLRGNEELIPRTSLPSSVRLIVGPTPRWWETVMAFLTGSGAFIGWIIATALGVLQILDLWGKRRKKHRETARPTSASTT